MWDHSAMKAEDPEQYIRDLERHICDLERRLSQTPGATPVPAPPQPFSPPSGSPSSGQVGGPGGGPYSGEPHGLWVSRKYCPRRRTTRLILAWVVAMILVGGFLTMAALEFGNPFGPTTVHGNFIMENWGAKETIACNDGMLTLEGDNNRYTITGHCRDLEVWGNANSVTVDSANIISAFGDDNAMTYHSGSPKITKSGNNNTVSQG
jgi:Protein of unknown function (DUF3060)